MPFFVYLGFYMVMSIIHLYRMDLQYLEHVYVYSSPLECMAGWLTDRLLAIDTVGCVYYIIFR